MVILQHDAARRYFGRATTADNRFAPGWLAYGNAFAAQDESDQVSFLTAWTAGLAVFGHLKTKALDFRQQRGSNIHIW